MARVTVEDCVERIPNRFELVLLATKRTRDLLSGAQMTLPQDNDKLPVVSLREFAQNTVDIGAVKDSLTANPNAMQDEDEIEDNFKEEVLIGREDVVIGADDSSETIGEGFQSSEATMEELVAEEEADVNQMASEAEEEL